MATFSHGDAQDLVARLKRAWERRDVDAMLECFSDDAEIRPDPFEAAITGSTELRAWCNGIAAATAHTEADAERIWLAGDAVLVAFHGAWTTRRTADRQRIRGMLALELDDERRIRRARAWALARVVGSDSTVHPAGDPAAA
ncbi:MAG TPA: nuclear transport factor 2 family protein [Candidatus Limnocylindrales bacterium]|jgi:ketosteroid isomerase-like protein